jgi:hypothetical protein
LFSKEEVKMAAIKGSQVKAILNKKGFNTKLIKVTTERSFIKVKVLDWSISLKDIEDALKHLNTVENISNDMDSIYIGDTLVVGYDYNKIPELMLDVVSKEIDKRCDFDPLNFQSIHCLATDLSKNEMISHIDISSLKILIKEASYRKIKNNPKTVVSFVQ